MPCCAYSCQTVVRAAPDTESARARAEAGAKVRGQVEPTALRYYLMLGTTVLVVACGVCRLRQSQSRSCCCCCCFRLLFSSSSLLHEQYLCLDHRRCCMNNICALNSSAIVLLRQASVPSWQFLFSTKYSLHAPPLAAPVDVPAFPKFLVSERFCAGSARTPCSKR